MSFIKYVAGIDFGTTNSAVSVSDGGAPHIIQLAKNSDTIPTALFFDDIDKKIYMGFDAYERYREPFSEGRFMRSLKRILGTPAMIAGTQIQGRHVKFEDIIGYFIRHLKEKTDETVKTDVCDVVLGRPVHFRDNDASGDESAQNQLENIAKKVGFKNIAFQYEPIAAAFAHERNLTSEKLTLVVDIGGGTSDFTVIRLGPLQMNKIDRTDDILANTGVRVGGNDFDKDFALDKFMPIYGLGTNYKTGGKILPVPNAPYIDLATWSSVNRVYTPHVWNLMRSVQIGAQDINKIARLMNIIENNLGHTNLDYIEQAKIDLSNKNEITKVFDFLNDAPEIMINTTEFIYAIENNVNKIKLSMLDCLKYANIQPSDINMILLTGGSTQIPYLISTVRNIFPHAVLSDTNKMASVGLGLAYDAIRKFIK